MKDKAFNKCRYNFKIMKKILRFLKKQKMNLILLLILSFHIYNIRNELFYNKLDESWYINVQERFSSLKQGNLSVENLIFDPEIYALAGWLYIHGVPPNEFNFEHPPLAKFFIGFSEILFQNPTTMNGLFSLAVLIIIYLLSIKLLGKTIFALIPVYMLSLEKLFLSEARSSMLDIYAMFFISLSVLIFLYAIKNHKLFLILSIIIGFGVACKWESGLITLAFITFLLVNKDWRKLGYFMASLPLAFLVYTSSYTTYFLSGHSFLDFLTLQLSIYKFHSSFPFYQGALRIWPLLLAGIIGPETRTIFYIDEQTGEVIKIVATKGLALTYSFNPLTWTISIFTIFISLLKAFNKFKEWRIIPFWFLSFIIPLSSGLVLEHHLLTFMPSFILSITYILKNGYNKGEKREKTILLTVIVIYLTALMIWHKINIPHFLAI
ncbi:MAG: glycosyltransferase family 39 protein [Candidatus Bathyarchaeia archaeon]